MEYAEMDHIAAGLQQTKSSIGATMPTLRAYSTRVYRSHTVYVFELLHRKLSHGTGGFLRVPS